MQKDKIDGEIHHHAPFSHIPSLLLLIMVIKDKIGRMD